MTSSLPRKLLRSALILALVLLVLFSALFLTVAYMSGRTAGPRPSDTIIILGAGINMDGTPKAMLQYRLDVGLALYEKGLAPHIITTGAQGPDEPMPEAIAMKAYLVAKGVPEAAIACDSASYNTRQNIENASAIMEAAGMQSAIVVTNAYHLWRSMRLAADAGIDVSGAAAPNAYLLTYALRYNFRETLSMGKYLLDRVLLVVRN